MTRQDSDLHGDTRAVFSSDNFLVSERVYRPKQQLARHDHDRASLSVVLAGAYEETFGRHVRHAEPGTVIAHPEGEHHAERHGMAGARLLAIELTPGTLRALRPAMNSIHESWHRKDDRIIALASGIRAQIARPRKTSTLSVESLVFEILAATGSQYALETRGSPWLLQVRDRLEDDHRPATMTELSTLAGVHPVYLARAFRRAFGCSIGQYGRQRQVGRAMKMLETGRGRLSDIALTTGFSDQSHMTRLLRAHTGLTPGAWKRRFAQGTG